MSDDTGRRIAELTAELEQHRNGAAPADPEAAARELTELLGLKGAGVNVTGGRIVGRGSTASADLYLDNGEAITFEALRDFANPTRLAVEIAACTGATPILKAPAALRALSLLRALSEIEETTTEDDVSRDWGIEYLQSATRLEVDMRDQADRWRAFCGLQAANPAGDARDDGVPLVQTQVVLVDHNGARLVRCGWFLAFVRESAYISPKELAERMARVGWARRGDRGAIKATAPGRQAWLAWSFYVVPKGWERLDADE
jgi:hypothetical protein